MKKFVSVLIALLITFAMLPCGVFAADDAPVEISDRAGLEAIANDPWGSYVLCSDIDLGDALWVPFDFFGTLDGNGHTIYNLNMAEPGRSVQTTIDGNHKEYPTVFAALFSCIKDAQISNLSLKGIVIDVVCEQSCFAASIAGMSENSRLVNCHAQGLISLDCKGKMSGVAGLVGFGSCDFENCSVDTTLNIVDMVKGQDCEEFLGGILACGFGNITQCDIKIRAYSSVYGYVHNGAGVGMHHVHTKEDISCIMQDCTVDAEISFFEKVASRRAYCSATIGENLHKDIKTKNNKINHYDKNEVLRYKVALSPEQCEIPNVELTVIEPTVDSWGYTIHTCLGCGFSYSKDYVKPIVLAQSIELSKAELELICNEVQTISAVVSPGDVTAQGVSFESSDESVAVVSENGMIVGIAPGEAVITCTSADGAASAQCVVSVHYSLAQWIHHYILFGWLSD